MGQFTLVDEDAVASMGEAALGLITAGPYDYSYRSAANATFVSEYNAEFRRNPDAFALGAYDGMHLIYEALKKTTGDADADALIAAAKGMSWESPRGPVTIDPQTREMIQDIYLRRAEMVDGKIINREFDKIEKVNDTGVSTVAK
jgi:branched-chain amino acid transport system substrate-binding protein